MNWKVYKDFNNWISVDETEIEKAIFAYITGNRVVFTTGAINKISDILPDFHTTMGWNEGYKLDAYDWNEINSKNIKEKSNLLFGQAKRRVEYFIKTNQTDLIGKGVEIKEIETANDISVLTAKLALDKRM